MDLRAVTGHGRGLQVSGLGQVRNIGQYGTTDPMECERIADQLRRTLIGDAWHGPSVTQLVESISAARAARRPLAESHTIWEIVLHMTAWIWFSREALHGRAVDMPPEVDWPPVTGTTDEASWHAAVQAFSDGTLELADEIESLDLEKLNEIVPGREYDFYHLLHGVVQHNLYHAGQIALLRKSPT